jgi:probable phosphoglycerate mutase
MAELSPLSWHCRAPGGEGYESFAGRIGDWLDEQTAPAIVVAHGMVSGVLRGLALGLDIDGIANLPGGQGIVYHVKDGIHRRIEG